MALEAGWVELGNHRNGDWLQIVCNLRHISLLELGLDVHLAIVHPLHHLLGRGTWALGDWVRVWR